MHPLRNPLSSTFLSFLLLPLTNAYQFEPRQIPSNSQGILACDLRNIPNVPSRALTVFNITSECSAQFQTTCSSSSGNALNVEVRGSAIDPYLCGADLSTVLPKITPVICSCACRCTYPEKSVDLELQAEEACLEVEGNIDSCLSMVQSMMSVSSAASVSTSAWSNYTATATSSAPASISSCVRDLGPQEGFERKRRV